jgi:hypothetical protein
MLCQAQTPLSAPAWATGGRTAADPGVWDGRQPVSAGEGRGPPAVARAVQPGCSCACAPYVVLVALLAVLGTARLHRGIITNEGVIFRLTARDIFLKRSQVGRRVVCIAGFLARSPGRLDQTKRPRAIPRAVVRPRRPVHQHFTRTRVCTWSSIASGLQTKKKECASPRWVPRQSVRFSRAPAQQAQSARAAAARPHCPRHGRRIISSSSSSSSSPHG